MSLLNNIDIATIKRQSDVISRNLRENFANIKSAVNDNQLQINNINTGTSNAETVQARPFNPSLNDRLNQIGKGQENHKVDGGIVTVNGGDITKVDITEFTGTINGIEVVILAGTSAAISASALNNHRISVVVGNSDNTFSVVEGAEVDDTTLNPLFPAIAESQIMLAVIYIDDGAVDVTNNIYALEESINKPSFFIRVGTAFNQGNYDFANLIIDGPVTLDCTSTTGINLLSSQYISFNCSGNYNVTSNGSILVAGTHVIDVNGNTGSNGITAGAGGASGGTGGLVGFIAGISIVSMAGGKAGVGGDAGASGIVANGGGGSGGGASIISSGGTGGDGGDSGSATARTPITQPNDDISPYLFVSAFNVQIDGSITIDGDGGVDGADNSFTSGTNTGGAGGSGGNSSGNLSLLSFNDVTVGGTISLKGGVGGDGGDATNTNEAASGGGGGGGAGGLCLIRSQSFTLTGAINITGGIGGTAGVASGASTNRQGANGSNGSNGLLDQALYDQVSTDLTDTQFPINILGVKE